MKCNPERVSNIKLFINKYNWKGINYPSKIDDWQKFEKNDPTIVFNILHMKEKDILPDFISKHNSAHEKTIILFMFTNKEKEGWHYVAVRKMSALLHGENSKHKGDFYCLNCLKSLRTENKFKYHERLCKN